jgi:hypothetical protein
MESVVDTLGQLPNVHSPLALPQEPLTSHAGGSLPTALEWI